MISFHSDALVQRMDSSLVNVYVGLLLVMVFLSLVGNMMVLTALHLQHSNRRNSLDLFIANTAVSDIISSFSATFSINNAKLHWNDNSIICKMCYSLIFISYAVTTLTLCLATLDRFYGICFPIKRKQVRLLKKQTLSICVIWILSCLLFAPYVYAYNIQDLKHLAKETTTVQICVQTWGSTSEQIHFTLVVFFLLYLSPLALFCFVFVKVLQKLQEPSTASGGNAILYKKRKRTAILLVMLIFSHYLCWSPSILANVVQIFGRPSFLSFNVQLVLELLRFIRSVLNPLIYLSLYENFWNTWKELFSNSFTVTKKTSKQQSVPVSPVASGMPGYCAPQVSSYSSR